MSKFKTGQKVNYYPGFGKVENGIVKSVHPTEKDIVYVVFKCDNNWSDYDKYTGQAVFIEDLNPGWHKEKIKPEMNFVRAFIFMMIFFFVLGFFWACTFSYVTSKEVNYLWAVKWGCGSWVVMIITFIAIGLYKKLNKQTDEDTSLIP